MCAVTALANLGTASEISRSGPVVFFLICERENSKAVPGLQKL